MAWIVWDLDGTLVETSEMGELQPIQGSLETVHKYFSEGHRQTVFTSKFAPMPDSERNRLKAQIESDMTNLGFPPLEVWTGTTKPQADLFISKDAVTFDGDYDLLQSQVDYMLSERGLQPAQQLEQQAPVETDEVPT